MNDRWRTISRLLYQDAVDVETVRCPLCGHTEEMSKEMAEHYDLTSIELCADCYNSLPEIDGIPLVSCSNAAARSEAKGE